MQITHDQEGRPVVTQYERGDFVRLLQDEPGALGVGRAGDWGEVERVGPPGRLTVRLAGFSRPKTDAIVRLTDIPASTVGPCDSRGTPLSLRPMALPRRRSAPGSAVKPRSPSRIGLGLMILAGGGAIGLAVLAIQP